MVTLFAEIVFVSEIVECVGDCGICRKLRNLCIACEEYLLFVSVSVEFWFTFLAEIALVSDIVECFGNCGMCRRL